MHNLDAGLDVKWQMHTADAWGTPDVEETFTIGAYTAGRFPPRLFLASSPRSCRRKPTGRSGTDACSSTPPTAPRSPSARSSSSRHLRTLAPYSTRFGGQKGRAWPTVVDRTPSRVRHAFDWGVQQETITADLRVSNAVKGAGRGVVGSGPWERPRVRAPAAARYDPDHVLRALRRADDGAAWRTRSSTRTCTRFGWPGVRSREACRCKATRR